MTQTLTAPPPGTTRTAGLQRVSAASAEFVNLIGRRLTGGRPIKGVTLSCNDHDAWVTVLAEHGTSEQRLAFLKAAALTMPDARECPSGVFLTVAGTWAGVPIHVWARVDADAAPGVRRG